MGTRGMSEPCQDERDGQSDGWREQRGEDAAKLIERFGADGVEWLDRFLADYVFDGEPLDQVMTTARDLGDLPVAASRRSFTDD